jgi:hypothetical protein
MNVNEDERGKAVILRKVPCVVAIRQILCRRNHEHYLVKRLPHNECDGIGLVCGICDATAHMIFDAIEKEGSKR